VVERLSPKPAPEKDTLGEIDKLVAIMDRLRPQVEKESIELASGAEASTWERVGSLLVNLLQPAMGPIGTALAMKLTGGAPGTGLSPATTPDGFTGTSQPVSSAPENKQPAQPTPVPNAPGGSDPRLKPVSPELAQAQQLILMGGDRIVAKLREGMKGHEFADLLIAFYGQDAWAFMARLGPDKLMEVLQSVPPLWEQVQIFREAYLREWCRQFVDYEAEIAKEEEQQKQKGRSCRIAGESLSQPIDLLPVRLPGMGILYAEQGEATKLRRDATIAGLAEIACAYPAESILIGTLLIGWAWYESEQEPKKGEAAKKEAVKKEAVIQLCGLQKLEVLHLMVERRFPGN
jgi:hypothetical protein